MTIACFMFYSLILTAAGFNLGVQWHKRRLEHKTEPEAHVVPWPDGQDEAFEPSRNAMIPLSRQGKA